MVRTIGVDHELLSDDEKYWRGRNFHNSSAIGRLARTEFFAFASWTMPEVSSRGSIRTTFVRRPEMA